MPTEAGLYWAKTVKTVEWWPLIVHVKGEAPMLYIACVWDREGVKGHGFEPVIYKQLPFEIAEWGPKIEEPDARLVKSEPAQINVEAFMRA